MAYPYYTGNPLRHAATPADLPIATFSRRPDPKTYMPDAGLIDAVNVALLLGQPLLLTGEPGTGKTQLAFNLAAELGYPEPLMFETKSSTMSRDVFYTYDTLGRFHAAQTQQGSQRSLDYLTYNVLGKAILLSRAKDDVREWLTADFEHYGAALHRAHRRSRQGATRFPERPVERNRGDVLQDPGDRERQDRRNAGNATYRHLHQQFRKAPARRLSTPLLLQHSVSRQG